MRTSRRKVLVVLATLLLVAPVVMAPTMADDPPAQKGREVPIGKVPPGAKYRPFLNAYFQQGFKDMAWKKGAIDKVLENWTPDIRDLPATGQKTVLISTIERDGRISGARDHVRSGNASWDKAAVEALRKVGAFDSLPRNWPYARLEVHWHFEVVENK